MCISYLFVEKWTTCSHVQSCNWCSFNSSFSQFSEQIVNSKPENVIPEDLLIWYAVPAFSVVRFLSPARKVSCWMLIYAKQFKLGSKSLWIYIWIIIIPLQPCCKLSTLSRTQEWADLAVVLCLVTWILELVLKTK